MQKLKQNFFGMLKDGWKDKGKCILEYDSKEKVYLKTVCNFDNTRARIAIKDERTVLYCPKCLTILKEQ